MRSGQLQGQVFVFFVIVVAAAEAAVGLAIIILIHRNRKTLECRKREFAESTECSDSHLSLDDSAACRCWALPPTVFLAGAGRSSGHGRRAFLHHSGVSLALEAVREFFSATASQIPWIKSYFTWISAGGFQADFALQVDQLTVIMLLVVTGVGWLIHIYSSGYMHDDPGYRRFFSYLNLFMFFMLVLVLAANYLLMFVGWEGVGLCSYLLIGFCFLKQSATNAGNKAFWVNRIGDFGFLLGVLLIFRTFGTLNFTACAAARGFDAVAIRASVGMLTAIALLLFVGAAGKSAQLPLYVWLPDAMEGPTPVSALIHAATMVTAGVYMVVRSHAIFLNAPIAMHVVAISAAPRRCSPRRSAWCRPTSRKCWPTRRSRSSATCSWPAASALSAPAYST